MKKIFVVCALMVSAWTVNNATAQRMDGPELTPITDTEINFGTIEQGKPVTKDFQFKNTGSNPLIITNAEGSCGCTVPKKPDAPILPGKTGVITISYDAKNIGSFNKTVTITTNETEGKDGNGKPLNKTHLVRISGTVK